MDYTKKPIRPDSNYLRASVNLINSMKWIVVLLLVAVIALSVSVYMILKRPMMISVIDANTGKTYVSRTYTSLGDDIIKRQLLYYSKEFCEQWWSLDYESIKDNRAYALKLIHSQGELIKKIPENFLNDGTVNTTIAIKNRSSFEWTKLPEITRVADPYYTVYCEFTRSSGPENKKKNVEKFYIKMFWFRDKEFNPYERNHGYYVVDMNKIEYGSTEWKEQINALR